MDRLQIVAALQTVHDHYFRLLLENYPLRNQPSLLADFGPPELCDLAIEAHSFATCLGSTARERLFHLGFDLLYPFDNPVDLYNWRARVKAERIQHTSYSSIAIRIDSELKRLRRVLEIDEGITYDRLPTTTFLVSKDRYNLVRHDTDNSELEVQESLEGRGTNMHIETVNIGTTADSEAISGLEKLEMRTTVWSNFSNVVNVLRSLVGG